MNSLKRLRDLALGCALVLATATGSNADVVPLNLTLSPASGDVNTLDISVTISTFGSDSDDATVTGNLPADFEISFDSQTHEADVTGITFFEQTPGSISLSDVHLSFLFGLARVDSSGIKATLRTPPPPGPVNDGNLNTIDHMLILNSGQFDAVVSGQEPVAIDLGATPLEATTDAQGFVAVSPPTIVDELATYDVTITLPVSFDDVVLEDPVTASVAVSGTLEATGQFSRTILLQQILIWDEQGDGDWDEIVLHEFSRWREGDSQVLFFPDGEVDAVVRTDTVTVAETHGANSLSVESGGVSIAPEQTLIVANDATMAAGTTLNVAAGGQLDVDGSLEMTDSQYVCGLGGTAPGLIDVAGDVHLNGQNTLTLEIDGSDPFQKGPYPLITSAEQAQFTGNFNLVSNLGAYVTDNSLSLEDGILTLTLTKNLNAGDANLDGVTDVRDFNKWNAAKFTSDTDWASGDFDGDGMTDVRDFNKWNAAKFTSAGDAVGNPIVEGQVPEPSSLLLLAGGMLGWLLAWQRFPIRFPSRSLGTRET